MLNSLLQISINGPKLNSMGADDFIKQAPSRWLNECNRRKVSRRVSEGKLHQMETESSGNAAVVAMHDASIQADFELTASMEALKEEVDAALELFKIHDANAVDFSDNEDDVDYLSESSSGEADW